MIHHSKKFPNVNSCKVAVHFAQIEDNADGTYRTVENSEFVIAREAHRNNASNYTINNRRVHFKEVAALLKKHNVDLDHNRFLILQVSKIYKFVYILTSIVSSNCNEYLYFLLLLNSLVVLFLFFLVLNSI